jgi:hypothetical protein
MATAVARGARRTLMDLAPVHWAIFFALLAVPVAGCVVLNWFAVRAATRPRRPADPQALPLERRFLVGYLPYTAVPVAALLAMPFAASGPMAAAGAIAALVLSLSFALLQLAILWLRPRPDDRFGFHVGCLLVTLGNLVVVPGLLAGVAWLLR